MYKNAGPISQAHAAMLVGMIARMLSPVGVAHSLKLMKLCVYRHTKLYSKDPGTLAVEKRRIRFANNAPPELLSMAGPFSKYQDRITQKQFDQMFKALTLTEFGEHLSLVHDLDKAEDERFRRYAQAHLGVKSKPGHGAITYAKGVILQVVYGAANGSTQKELTELTNRMEGDVKLADAVHQMTQHVGSGISTLFADKWLQTA
jgi:hypothetical protein